MKVTPKTKERKQVDFTTLNPSNAFLWHGGIWFKLDDDKQGCANLNTGQYFSSMCGEYVVPVNATVTWKHKEDKKNIKSPK